MVGDETVVAGASTGVGQVEAVIRRPLGLPQPEPVKKTLIERLLRNQGMDAFPAGPPAANPVSRTPQG